ncbi:MAG: PilX N-terminal domain-containing pilus assembly protein [Thiohalomonadaceae bacterium]
MTHVHYHIGKSPGRQSGVALILALVMLIIATLTGLAGIRNTSLQEKLSGNLYDRAVTMQSAEFAMGQVEKWLYETKREDILATANIIDCTTVGATCKPVPDSTFQNNNTNWQVVNLGNFTFNTGLNATSNPQYHIQYLGLKNSLSNTDTSQSATPPQYGSTGGGSNKVNSTQNAAYLVTVRSRQPGVDNDRSIVVLSALVKSN